MSRSGSPPPERRLVSWYMKELPNNKTRVWGVMSLWLTPLAECSTCRRNTVVDVKQEPVSLAPGPSEVLG